MISAPEELRYRFRNFRKSDLIERCSRLRPSTDGPDAGVKKALRRLARRCKMLNDELADVDAEIDVLVHRCAPALLELDGVGPGVAATLLVAAGDYPHRLRSEASFAHMAGAAPLPTDSGLTSGRDRLNRGGNRQANNALWDDRADPGPDGPAHQRLRRPPHGGKTKKEIVRCLKRYVTREVYQVIIRSTALLPPVAQT